MRQGGVEEEQHSINAEIYLASRAMHTQRDLGVNGWQYVHIFPEAVFLHMSTSLTAQRRSRYQFCGHKDRAMRAMNHQTIGNYLAYQGCPGSFISPYAPHLVGVWERQSGTIRRILAAMLLETKGQKLTHELLVILMSEVSAIVNAYLIRTISSDSDEPFPLTPSMLLTQKQVQNTVVVCHFSICKRAQLPATGITE